MSLAVAQWRLPVVANSALCMGTKTAILDCLVEHVFDVMCMCDNTQILDFCLTGQFFNAQHWLGWVAVKGFLLTRYN